MGRDPSLDMLGLLYFDSVITLITLISLTLRLAVKSNQRGRTPLASAAPRLLAGWRKGRRPWAMNKPNADCTGATELEIGVRDTPTTFARWILTHIRRH
eukprot:5374888-Pleurochrysis_carterae.AAC.2